MKTVLVLVVIFLGTQSLPQYLRPCHLNKPNFNKCALEHANYAIPRLVKGDKEYNIPSLQPLQLPLVEILENNFKLSLKKLKIHGLENTVTTDMNMNKKHINLAFHMNRLRFIGDYNLEGNILFFNVLGSGAVNITAVGVDLILNANLEQYEKNNIKYLKYNRPSIQMNLERCYFYFENLLNDQKDTGIDINKILNDNWKEFLDNIDSSLKETIASLVESIVNKILEKTPETDIFPG